MGHALNDGEIKAIYEQVDKNRDGKINFPGPFALRGASEKILLNFRIL
jgi:hypothetical protein